MDRTHAMPPREVVMPAPEAPTQEDAAQGGAARNGSAPKFVLIDPSVVDYRGHYYEHGLRVLKAAESHGFRPVLAANRRFRESPGGDVEVHAVYKFGFWVSFGDFALLRQLGRWRRSARRAVSRLKVRLAFSRLGLLFTLARHHDAPKEDSDLGLPPTASWLLLRLVWLVSLAWRVGGAVPRRIGRLASRQGRLYRWASRAWQYPTALLTRHFRGATLKVRQFARDTRWLFRRVPLNRGDSVFIACVSADEVAALIAYFRRDPRSRLADWHLLMRHQLHHREESDPQRLGLEPLRSLLAELRKTFPEHRVHFFTDTVDLAEHYNLLRVFRFRPLPVPVEDEYHALRRKTPKPPPLRIAYVGDAREEKGYPFLPHLVEELWADYVATGRVEFVFQSNVVADANPASVIARSQLALLPRDKVTLMEEPLDGRAYRDLVLGADVLLLPYNNPAHYLAASSGILVEALSCGTPVVVPAGSWMSIQLARPVFQYHQRLRREASLVGGVGARDLHWQSQEDWQGKTLDGDRLMLEGSQRRQCSIPVPIASEHGEVPWHASAVRGTSPRTPATHLLITFQPQAERRGNFVEIALKQFDDSLRPVAERVYQVGGDHCGSSVLVELASATRRLQVGFRNAFNASRIELTDLRFDFLEATEPLPLSAIGTVFCKPGELTDAVREIIDHHEHYHRTAQQFSVEWVRYHNVTNLMNLLLERTRPVAEVPTGGAPRAPRFLSPRQSTLPLAASRPDSDGSLAANTDGLFQTPSNST